jgi:hypothetical protein
MGWLFGKKKPRVPFPEGRPMDEKVLRFPNQEPRERIIEPEMVKEAVGFERPMTFPRPAAKEKEQAATMAPPRASSNPLPSQFNFPPQKQAVQPASVFSQEAQEEEEDTNNLLEERDGEAKEGRAFRSYQTERASSESGPLFIKVDVYQRILGEFDLLKDKLGELSKASTGLENSEYNEEDNFAKLKKSVRLLHDKLLVMDKTLFKSQGD